MNVSTPLSQHEAKRLIQLEATIERGKRAFVEVGQALAEIRDSRIYRTTHSTFEAYFQEKLGLEKSHVKQLIDAAKVVANLETSAMAEVPKNERQARPLVKLHAEEQPAAWEKAQKIAAEEGKPVTARHVEAAVDQVRRPNGEVFVYTAQPGDAAAEEEMAAMDETIAVQAQRPDPDRKAFDKAIELEAQIRTFRVTFDAAVSRSQFTDFQDPQRSILNQINQLANHVAHCIQH